MVWADYVVLARDLEGQEFEAARRSAVSRAYYGVFNAARRQLEAHDVPIANHRAHDQVWRAFRSADRATPETNEKWLMVGDLGGALRALRNQADYADVVPGLECRAGWAVAIAERIQTLLDELDFS